MPEFSWFGWVVVALCAVMVGIAKTGIPGFGILVVPLMAMVLPARNSVGVLLGILILADLFAAGYYRRHAQWGHVFRLLPAAFGGIVAGYFALGVVSDEQLKRIIGAIVLIMLGVNYWWMKGNREESSVPHQWWFAAGLGFIAGVTTMMANAAGPIMIIYLLAMRLPKTEFVGTAAWFFFIINWLKVPFSANLDLMTAESVKLDLMMLPFIAAGAITGIFFLKRIPQKAFNAVVQILALAAAIWFNSHCRQASTSVAKSLTLAKSGVDKITSSASKLPKKWVIPPLMVAAILASSAAATMPDDNLHISFLNVGQGDAILIQKGNQQVLVDGGPSPQAIGLQLGKKLPFWDRTIELVVLTHPSADHVAGLVEVMGRYRIEQVLYPDLDFKSVTYNEWLRVTREKDIKRTIAQAGQLIKSGEVEIEVLNPQMPNLTQTESDIDNNGMVMRLSMGEVSFLLTADTMWEAEFELIAHGNNLRSTVLKIAHHGSNTSTTPEFLTTVNPQLAVISAGADNPFGHPSDEVMARLKETVGLKNIYRTDEKGTIEFITDGERLWVKTDLP